MKPSLSKELETTNKKKLAALKKAHGIIDPPVVIAKPITAEAKPKQHRFPSFKKEKEPEQERDEE